MYSCNQYCVIYYNYVSMQYTEKVMYQQYYFNRK